MQLRTSHLVRSGAIGGLAAGFVVAGWFLVVDLLAGQPFATPVALAGAFLGRPVASATFGGIAGYTALHLGVFVGLGALVGWGLPALGIQPALRHGPLFGIGVLNVVHYGATLAVGVETLTVLPSIHVLGANFLGGMVLMGYLHYAMRAESPLGIGVLRDHALITEGLVTGMVGAIAVAVWFLVLDVLGGRPFFTPAALGSAVFLGATQAEEVRLGLGMVGAYTVLHLVVFLGAGVAMVWAAERIERTPGLWLLAVMVFVLLEAGFVGVTVVLGGWVLGAVGWWEVLAGNLLAVASMGRRIWRAHPGLREKLVDEPVTTMV